LKATIEMLVIVIGVIRRREDEGREGIHELSLGRCPPQPC
jgi:hypothetical protein